MENTEIEIFARAAISIIVNDIIELDIIVPALIFDYSTNPNINNGYYMHQNLSGTIITLNMNAIKELRNVDDIKTVITYGFIHELIHMYQYISSKYKTDKIFYTEYEDTADKMTIDYILASKLLIESRLKFKINDVFLIGIERQLTRPVDMKLDFDKSIYVAKCIAGVLCNKLNCNFEGLYNLIRDNNDVLKFIFPDKREFYLDIYCCENEYELNLLVNLIRLTDFKVIYTGPTFKEGRILSIYLY